VEKKGGVGGVKKRGAVGGVLFFQVGGVRGICKLKESKGSKGVQGRKGRGREVLERSRGDCKDQNRRRVLRRRGPREGGKMPRA